MTSLVPNVLEATAGRQRYETDDRFVFTRIEISTQRENEINLSPKEILPSLVCEQYEEAVVFL